MAPVIKLTDSLGTEFVIELRAEEIRDLAADAAKLMTADQGTVSSWWRTLTDDKATRPLAPPARAAVAG